MNDEELREQLAAIEHERWADWQKWCHKVLRENNPSPEQGDILERWDRQIETPYPELSEKEKDSDREQVDRYWQLVQDWHTRKLKEAIVTEMKRLRDATVGYVGGSDYLVLIIDARIAELEKEQPDER